MLKEKSLKLNFLFNIILNISKVIFPLITMPYVARVLDPDGLGLFNFANTYAGYFALFAALGISYYGVREVAKYQEDIKLQSQFLSEIVSLTYLTTCLCTIVFIVSVYLIPQISENKDIFLISAIVLYITPFKVDWFFQGNEDFGYITIRSLVIKIIGIVALFAFVHEKQDLIIYVAINAICTTVNELWNFIKLYKKGIRINFTLRFRKHISPLLILFSSSVAISIYTILDTLMLGFMTDYAQVGFYNCATNISKCILPVTTSLSAVMMPRLSKYMQDMNWDRINQLMIKSLSVVAFLCFPITTAIIVLSPSFVPLFFGNQFCGAILPLQIVIGVVVAIGFNNLLGVQVLVGLGFDKLFLHAVLIGTFTNFTLNLFLIPTYGAVGAAIASVCAETLILLYEVVLVRVKTKVKLYLSKEIFFSFAMSLLYIPLMTILQYFTAGWLLVVIFVIMGSIIYLLSQYFLRNSIEMEMFSILKTKICK